MYNMPVKIILILFLCTTLFLSSCWLNPHNDEHNVNDDIDILPETIKKDLFSLVKNAPSLTAIRIIGYSSGDPSYPIYALKMTDNPLDEENEPELQVSGGIHGNEQLSCMVVIKLIEYMIDRYKHDDPVITDIINNTELHFFPVLNPHGLSLDKRHNANSVDLNRNFDWAWVDQPNHGDSPVDQPESQAIRDDSLEHPYVLSVHGHTGAVCINYLWDYIGTERSSGDPSKYSEEFFITNYLPTYPFISDTAATYKTQVNNAGDTSFWMTEGYEWYPVFGSLQDWQYGVRGCLAYTLEYHASFSHTIVNEPLFQEVFEYHKDSFITLFSQAQKGISGIITGDGGVPVDASVTITPEVSSRAFADPIPFSPFCFTDPDIGDYHLPVQPGTYTLDITADGYTPRTISGIVVPPDPGMIVRDIVLTPGRGEKWLPSIHPGLPADSIPPDLREE
jgi:hypothetical protein